MDWLELVKIFNLEEEVEKFVKEKIKKLIKEKHEFRFKGSDSTAYCDMKQPHPPHVMYYYNTVNYGELETFCLGRSGEIEVDGVKKKLIIVVERFVKGDAYSPTVAKGYYFFI